MNARLPGWKILQDRQRRLAQGGRHDAVQALGVRREDLVAREARRNSITVYTSGKEDAASAFAEIAGFLRKIAFVSQLR